MKSITTFLTGLFRSLENSPEEPVSPGKQEQNNQTASAQQTVSGEDLTTGPEPEGMDQWFPAAGADDEQERCGQEEPEARTEDDIITGGLYAVREQEDGPYWIAKVIYAEEQLVHVLCFAKRSAQLPQEMTEQDLTVGLNKEDGSFGLEHLPIPRAVFAANTVLLGQRPLAEHDFTGYRIYVDSVFDCLDEQAPDWLKKAGSYAAWRYDQHAMAALVDRYLIGVDLLRDTRKALYWLNRLVHASTGCVPPGASITQEEEILTGGIYACPQEDGSYRISKVLLKDKHGIQQLSFPSLLGQLSEEPHPLQAVEQASARRTGKPPMLSHAALDAAGFLDQTPLFLGLLPVSLEELHCYRAHLRKMFNGAEFRESAWENLQKRAAAGDLQAQMETAFRYIDGDPVWEVKGNIPEAIRWFTEAANQGHGLAAYNLALLFQQGDQGVPPDPQLGFEWLSYAAQLNYGLAQLHLADCYRLGQGIPANPALALAWYALALLPDNDLPEEVRKQAEQRKNEFEKTCSTEQRAEAEQFFQQLTKSS